MKALFKHLLLEAVGRSGTFDPDKTLFYIEESLTAEEFDTAEKFLGWCHKKGKTFGHNIESVFKEFNTSSPKQVADLVEMTGKKLETSQRLVK